MEQITKHRVSFDLDADRYEWLARISGQREIRGCATNAAVIRAALDLLAEACVACAHGDVIGTSSGHGKRTKRVIARKLRFVEIAATGGDLAPPF